MSSLSTLLNIRHPVLLAPMAGISGARLACAVSRAGGLGFIGGGYGERDWLAEQIDGLEGQPFGVGFITWALRQRPDLLDLALAARPRAVLLSFGDITGPGERVLKAGAVLVAQVQTVRQAREAAAAGAQLIVAHRRRSRRLGACRAAGQRRAARHGQAMRGAAAWRR